MTLGLAWAAFACSRDAAPEGVSGAVVDAAPPTTDAGPGGMPDAVMPDAVTPAEPGACGTAPRDLGLSLTPRPAADTWGDLVAVERLPGALRLTLRHGSGGQDTYTVTGPFDEVPDEGLPLGAQVSVQVAGGGFVLSVSPCGWAPLVVVSGTWAEIAPVFGPYDADSLDLCGSAAACPRDYAWRWNDTVTLRPGERFDTLQSHVVLGRLHGCLEDPRGPSKVEWVELPRRDGPACPSGARAEDLSERRAFEFGFTLRPEADTPDLRAHLVFEGPVDVDLRLPEMVITPTAPDPALASARFVWRSERPPPALAPPFTARVGFDGYGWWQNTAVELRDAAGLALVAVDTAPGWAPHWAAGVRWRLAPAVCLSVTGDEPRWELAGEGHPVTVTDGPGEATWQPGQRSLALGGRDFAIDQRSAHTWMELCSTDDSNGWVDFLLSRQAMP